MTCIVEGFKTKKALKEHVAKMDLLDPLERARDIHVSNPSPFPCGKFEYAGYLHYMPEGKKVIVTNHPKRSWFATIERKNGRLVVA